MPCLFGCQDALDSMVHYVQCPFWLFLLCKLSISPPSPFPVVRLGLVDHTIEQLKSVAASTDGYHAIRRAAKDLHLDDQHFLTEA